MQMFQVANSRMAASKVVNFDAVVFFGDLKLADTWTHNEFAEPTA